MKSAIRQFGRRFGPAALPRAALPLVVLLAIVGGNAYANLSREKILDLFTQGKSSFHEAMECVKTNPEKARRLFRRSAMAFETIVRDGGIHNGRLYYDIGNAYFRCGDLGRAILNYRRALRYTPNDPNLLQNLAWARARRKDRIPEPESRRVLRTLFFWHYDFSLRARSLVFMAAFACFWIALSLHLFRRSPWFRWSAGIAGFVGLMMFLSLALEYHRIRTERPGVVIAEQVVARKGDGETYDKAFTEPLHAGTEFLVVEDRGDWLEVALPDDRTCWLPRTAVALVR